MENIVHKVFAKFASAFQSENDKNVVRMMQELREEVRALQESVTLQQALEQEKFRAALSTLRHEIAHKNTNMAAEFQNLRYAMENHIDSDEIAQKVADMLEGHFLTEDTITDAIDTALRDHAAVDEGHLASALAEEFVSRLRS